MGTIIVGLIVAGAAVLAVAVICRDKKRGRSSCGGNCGACRMCSHKHSEK